jgi:hypothetical protein
VSDAVDPIATAVLVSRHLDGLQIAHTIGGSIASSFAGEPRATIDIDFVVALHERQVDQLAAALGDEFYVDADALRRAIRTKTSANLIERETQLKVDLFIAGGTPLDARQLARRLALQLRHDTVVDAKRGLHMENHTLGMAGCQTGSMGRRACPGFSSPGE